MPFLTGGVFASRRFKNRWMWRHIPLNSGARIYDLYLQVVDQPAQLVA